MDFPELFEPDLWCPLGNHERRDLLASALLDALRGEPGVQDTRIEAGTVERPYDYTAVVETDVGNLKTPLWSHARAQIFCDPSIHAANRRQLAPGLDLQRAIERLRSRLNVRFTLETRGLALTLHPEAGVERTWTAERARFRDRTAVTREDVIAKAGDVDLRDLLAHFYNGPSLRVEAEDGTAFLLPAASEEEGRLVTLCLACHKWTEGAQSQCTSCDGPVEAVLAARPARR
ncbi:MAG TPA: hypothetical protein VE871_16170 [Longimicrobium sp.]|nr:hypothetical protein [Longimicrobium sp.]